MQKYTLSDDMAIHDLYTFLYQEKGCDFLFPGERHDFWELIYVDQGYLYLLIDEAGYKVNQGEMYFFNRNQNHIVWSDHKTAPCFLTISFDMEFADCAFFEHRKFLIDHELKNIIAKLMNERLAAFEGALTSEIGIKRTPCLAGSEQLLKIYLIELLLKLYRRGHEKSVNLAPSPIIQQKSENMIYNRSMSFITEHLHEKLLLEQISRSVHVSPSYLNRIYRNTSGMSVMEHVAHLKLEKTKELIRESKMTLTEIADALGFSSIHYFSRLFKRHYGISPSAYSKSIRL
ncbi:MAG: AraC family transcriptional regulator [Clostridiaceae bacterium]|nr:AraC family transcriptional regulator [Clostridiaceae bacterium]